MTRILCLFLLSLLWSRCQHPTATAAVIAQPVQSLPQGAAYDITSAYELDVEQSLVGWDASYIAGSGHRGSIEFTSGRLGMDDQGQLNGGEFTIDMNKIRNLDQGDEGSRKDLENHLKSDDFFAVARFPKAYFTINSIKPGPDENKVIIDGILTMRGVSKPVSFGAVISKEADLITARAAFHIDRTKWGINYEAGSVLNSFKDAAISGNVGINLALVFWKPGATKRKLDLNIGC